jgi:hypothetical protein
MERVKRIELSRSAWKADVLPLNYTRRIPETFDMIQQVLTFVKYEIDYAPDHARSQIKKIKRINMKKYS